MNNNSKKIINPDLKKGDFVGMVYAQPGNESTFLLVLEVGEKIKCYDVFFNIELTVNRDKLWKLSDSELNQYVQHYDYGRISVLDRLNKVARDKHILFD